MSVVHNTDDELNVNVKGQGPSKFTWKDFRMLSDPKQSYRSNLSVIGFIDLNAFFAQVEQVRLGLSADTPVVCAQWKSVIAVSYSARKFGISRMDSIDSAIRKCPKLVVAHAAVYRKGESYWTYHDNLPSAVNHKVSLDPYRRESRKILKILRSVCDHVEKASVDECYLDFGRLIYSRLVGIFPELGNQSQDDEDLLPVLPETIPIDLSWKGIVFGTSEYSNACPPSEPNVLDWDDLCFVIGSQLLYNARKLIYEELEYTTSGGLGNSKKLAKLGGGYKKPDGQTVIRNSKRFNFLDEFALNDLTGMGGKIGAMVLDRLNVPDNLNSINYLRNNYDLKSLKDIIDWDPNLANLVFELVRGERKDKLASRIELKSSSSTKNFASSQPVSTLKDARDWLRVFSADLINRIIEVDDENTMGSPDNQNISVSYITRPRTLTLYFLTSSNERFTKQTSIPFISVLEKLQDLMFETGIKLLSSLQHQLSFKAAEESDDVFAGSTDSSICPISCMSLTMSNFSKVSNSTLIDAFMSNTTNSGNIGKSEGEVNTSDNIIEYAYPELDINNKMHLPREEVCSDRSELKKKENIRAMFEKFNSEYIGHNASTEHSFESRKGDDLSDNKAETSKPVSENFIADNFCSKCELNIEDEREHRDYHIAFELSCRLNGRGSLQKENLGRKRFKSSKVQSTLPF